MIRWSVPPDWTGQTGFIIAGGPSVAGQNLDLLRSRRIIVINSSWVVAPWADYLFFGDSRWWRKNCDQLGKFRGQIVTVSNSVADPRLRHLEKVKPPPPLANRPSYLAMQRTSLQGAINMAVHLKANPIVLLGADMKPAASGRTHHHQPHPWPIRPKCWDEQMQQLRMMVGPLKELGVEVINTSLESRIDWWPKRALELCL